jgi:hypothetical protein
MNKLGEGKNMNRCVRKWETLIFSTCLVYITMTPAFVRGEAGAIRPEGPPRPAGAGIFFDAVDGEDVPNGAQVAQANGANPVRRAPPPPLLATAATPPGVRVARTVTRGRVTISDSAEFEARGPTARGTGYATTTPRSVGAGYSAYGLAGAEFSGNYTTNVGIAGLPVSYQNVSHVKGMAGARGTSDQRFHVGPGGIDLYNRVGGDVGALVHASSTHRLRTPAGTFEGGGSLHANDGYGGVSEHQLTITPAEQAFRYRLEVTGGPRVGVGAHRGYVTPGGSSIRLGTHASVGAPSAGVDVGFENNSDHLRIRAGATVPLEGVDVGSSGEVVIKKDETRRVARTVAPVALGPLATPEGRRVAATVLTPAPVHVATALADPAVRRTIRDAANSTADAAVDGANQAVETVQEAGEAVGDGLRSARDRVRGWFR